MGGKTTLGNGRETNLANVRESVSLRAVDLGKGYGVLKGEEEL